jgi:tetratricopeptide (TPR) repeat protein/tRNA A-37 threonylcarbamoyl transferase component Bud32
VTELRDDLQAALGTTYRIEQELGGGGMSRVFLAEEVALGRKVVIKVLPPEMVSGVNQDRFRREIQLAARLQHPHIVPLLAAGASGDLLWYAMPFIEGESLRVRLARQGDLPVKDAIQILREIADALGYAHAQGVVHRDIKPDNILVSGRHVLVTDFGVAKAVSDSAKGQSLTSLGMALGTPAYMAPEQASADPHVDHRADIYALGAMAYEMLSGQPPFTGANPQAVLAAHVMKAPEAVSAARPAVPPALNALVMRCLEKRPSDRWQNAEELGTQLDLLLTPSGGTAPTAAVAAVSSGTEAALKRANPLRVAALFAAASVVVLSLVWLAVQRLGLPDWVFYVGIGLMAAGLPIMLLTAQRERQRALARITGTHAIADRTVVDRLLTWRSAIRGGGLAFTGLSLGAAAFMGLRLAGVGPFATLVSSGVLNARDPLIVAEFTNRTADSTLGTSITEALRIDLAQSQAVRLVGPDAVARTLQLMQQDPAVHLTEQLAREVSARLGARGVVAGEISSLAGGYVLSVRLVSAADGSTLLAGRETADDASGIIAAVEKLSRKLREGIGESLRNLRAEPPLAQVTTGSLAALKAYSDGARAADEARDAEAVRLLQQAVTLDSNFAMAWRKLGVAISHLGNDREGEVAAITRAYQLRDRLPPREANHIEAYYFNAVVNDRTRSIPSYERLVAAWPDDDIALSNLAEAYGAEERFAEMERLERQVTSLGQFDAIVLSALLSAQLAQGNQLAADSTLAIWAEKLPGNLARQRALTAVARGRGQFERALGVADSLTQLDDPRWRAIGHAGAAQALIRQGRIRESQQRVVRAVAEADRARDPLTALGFAMDRAQAEIVLGNRPDAAIAQLETELAQRPLEGLQPGNRPYGRLVSLYAMAGKVDRAQALQTEYERLVPELLRNAEPWAAYGQGQLALARGDGPGALAQFRIARNRWWCRTCTMLEEGYALELGGQTDSALATYERLASLGGHVWEEQFKDMALPVTYQRLGELYEARGDKAKALDYYSKFVDLWRGADPDLQPKVREIQKRIGELAGEKP